MSDHRETSQQSLLSLDMEKYLSQIDDWEMTEAQKCEFIEAMYSLLLTIAELNLGISRVHEARKACGQVEDNPSKAPLAAPDAVYLDEDHTNNRKADEKAASKEYEEAR